MCDTVGHATPAGARALVAWTRRLVDLLFVNLRAMGWMAEGRGAPELLRRYVEAVSRACKLPIPPQYPVFGARA